MTQNVGHVDDAEQSAEAIRAYDDKHSAAARVGVSTDPFLHRGALLLGDSDAGGSGAASATAGRSHGGKSGPRTRFGDGDGSWWDRWLGFKPPSVSRHG